MSVCRICLETDGPLVHVCACRGTNEFVHTACLDQWRCKPDASLEVICRCGTCKDSYRDSLSLQLLRVRLCKERKGSDPGAPFRTMCLLGNELRVQGQFAEAEPLMREALAAARKALGDRHPSTLDSVGHLAQLLLEQGNLAGAEPLLREALKGRRDTLGNQHPDTLHSISSLELLLKHMGYLHATTE